MTDGPEWFAPKRYGHGSGPPIAWQGWALTLGFVAIVGFGCRSVRRTAVVAVRSDYAARGRVHGHLRPHDAGRLALALGRGGRMID